MTTQPVGRPQDTKPSNWVRRWSHLVPAGATVLDVACGSGRHVRWFAARGCRITGVDRNADAVSTLSVIAEIVVADIEAGPWPFMGRRFDLVLVTNYLWRERMPDIVASLAPGGLLFYETFAAGNETVGKPSNPRFLLRPGELLEIVAGLQVVAFEEGFETAPERFVQRIVAAKRPSDAEQPARSAAITRFHLLSSECAARLKSGNSEGSL